MVTTLNIDVCVHAPDNTCNARGLQSYAFDKTILVQPWTGPEGSRSLKLPDFETVGT